LLLYPLPCLPAGGSAESLRWRRGAGGGGYQDRLEALMRTSYSRPQLSLESYCDDILLDTTSFCGHERNAAPEARTLAALRNWFGHFPWHASDRSTSSHRLPAAHLTQPSAPLHARGAVAPGRAQFPALRRLAAQPHADANCPVRSMPARISGSASPAVRTPARESGFEARRESVLDGSHMRRLVDAVEIQLDQLQQLVDQQALREARPLADKLRDLVLRPAVAVAMRRRGAALIKLVYRHDNDTDALLAFTQDELDALERVLSEAEAGRPLAYS
jgi:hypothetical protein